MLARVRVGGAPAEARPTGHLVLGVTDGDGNKWHADVGFGLGTLLDPIPFGPDPDTVHEQSSWPDRVVQDGSELVLQTRGPDGWSDVYGLCRVELRGSTSKEQRWICTKPALPVCVRADRLDQPPRPAAPGHLGLQRTAPATTMTPHGVESSEQPPTVIPDKLQQFGLLGFQLGQNRRIQRDRK